MSTNELNSKIYYKLLLFIGVFIGVLFFGRMDVSASDWEVKDSGNTSSWQAVTGGSYLTAPNGDTLLSGSPKTVSYGTNYSTTAQYNEIITESKVVGADDDSDYVTVTYKYYVYHKITKGSAYSNTYQITPLQVYINGEYTGVNFDMTKAGSFSDKGWRYGSYITVKLKKGVTYTIDFVSTNYTGSGALTDAEHTIYRTYNLPIYTVKFYNSTTESNSTLVKTQSVRKYQKATAPTNLTKTGYTFADWDTDAYLSVTKDLNVHATWTPNTYYVAYNGNGATSGSMSKSTFTYNTSGTLRSNTFTRTGYTFTGWNTEKDGSGTSYSDGATVKNLTTENGKTITLYAQWKANNYTVTIYPNGGILNGGNFGDSNGTSNKAQVTVTYGSTNYHGLGTATRTGYTFLGFYTAKTGGTQVWDANGYSTVSKYYNSSKQWIYDGNLTVYAQWYNNPPEITTGKLPSDTSNTNSGIPPYIDGDYVIIQKGDAFDIYDYFDYSDVETAKEDLKVTIKNNVPTDSKGNTTTAGTYIVTVTVTDEGGASTSAEVKVIVNDPPTLTAKDRWFYTGEVVDESEILAKVSAVDYEDGDIKGVFNKKKV